VLIQRGALGRRQTSAELRLARMQPLKPCVSTAESGLSNDQLAAMGRKPTHNSRSIDRQQRCIQALRGRSTRASFMKSRKNKGPKYRSKAELNFPITAA
jgi:hypothetical protein